MRMATGDNETNKIYVRDCYASAVKKLSVGIRNEDEKLMLMNVVQNRC